MPIAAKDLDAALAYADAHMGESLERLRELVRIKSISTDPAYAAECQRAADWLVADLGSEGFAASARPTPGHPVVVAHAPRSSGPKWCSTPITTSSRSTRSSCGTPIHSR